MIELGSHIYGIKVTNLYADSTADAGLGVNVMYLAPFAADGIHGAIPGTDGTACAGFCLYFKIDQ